VYSYTGRILIAVNPWRAVNIYSNEILRRHASSAEPQEPHIYAVAGQAHRACVSNTKSQCILISGESGSGKTESTKHVLQVLTVLGASGEKRGQPDSGASLEEKIMLANPVLEAYGNAKTLRNNNSSRFGRGSRQARDGQEHSAKFTSLYCLIVRSRL
jgi:myosin heavy subunit